MTILTFSTLAKLRFKFMLALLLAMFVLMGAGITRAHDDGGAFPIAATPDKDTLPDFAIMRVRVERFGSNWLFSQTVTGKAGATIPVKIGQLAGAKVESYVWPTDLDSSIVGFEPKQGILALALTSHPDFLDTMAVMNGSMWHPHWIVLVQDNVCGPDTLHVRDIPEGTTPALPATWPKLPILLDSPVYPTEVVGNQVVVSVPDSALKSPGSFKFDGVTAELTVNTATKAPLLCVTKVRSIASGKLNLPGIAR